MDEKFKNNYLKERVKKYINNADNLFEGVEDSEIDPEYVKKNSLDISRNFRTMAYSYFSDAKHFYEQGMLVEALGALEYAEGWLDAGREIGIFKFKREFESI